MTMRKLNLLLIITLFLVNANAQIVYTDINPDGMPSGGGIDFNGDGTNEFSLTSSDYITYAWSSGGTNIWANGTDDVGWDVPNPLIQGTVIDGNGNFIGAGDVSMDGWGQGTPFSLNQDSYMGCRLSIDGQTHFGWIKVMWDGTNFIYKEFAYQSAANTAINSGDSGATTGISDLENNTNFTIYPNPAKDIIIIDNNSQLNISKIEIVDLLGKRTSEFSVSNANSQTINISELNEGIYLIVLFEGDNRIDYKKIVIE